MMTDEPLTMDDHETTLPMIPRRHVLRAVTGAAVGGVVLATLTACGGEDDGDDDD